MAKRKLRINDLIDELQDLKRGFGIHISVVEKLNAKPHLRRALGFTKSSHDLDTALKIRAALVGVIESDDIQERDRIALQMILNYQENTDYAQMRLGRREHELEAELDIGRKKRHALETTAIRVLAEKLLRLAGLSA